MFEDLTKRKELYMSDKDIIKGLGIYIEAQKKKYMSQRRDLLYMNNVIYEKGQLLLKAKEEINMLHIQVSEQKKMIENADELIEKLKEKQTPEDTQVPDMYHKAFENGYCDIDFRKREITWSGEATLNVIGRFEDELIEMFGKDKIKEISDGFKVINNDWKTTQ